MRIQSKTSSLPEGEGGGGRGEHEGCLAAAISFSFILMGWRGGVNLRAIYSEDTSMPTRI